MAAISSSARSRRNSRGATRRNVFSMMTTNSSGFTDLRLATVPRFCRSSLLNSGGKSAATNRSAIDGECTGASSIHCTASPALPSFAASLACVFFGTGTPRPKGTSRIESPIVVLSFMSPEER